MNTDKNIKVSVIMPVYNRAGVLSKAVRSVMNQTLREIELLCINDGSTDSSVTVLKRLAKSDPRIRVLSQRNAGAGPAKNYGIRRADGEFIAFLDSDDWYASEHVLEKLYQSAIAHQVKICIGGSRKAKRGKLQPLEEPGKIYFTKEALIDYKDYQFSHGYCRGIYKRDLLLDNNICFPPYRRYEDPPFFVKTMICAGRFYAVPDIVLIYDESCHYRKIVWDERTVTDLLKGIRDVLCMAAEQRCTGLQATFIERICRGDWSEILSQNLRRSWAEAESVMEEANCHFLNEALRLYGLPAGEKPFDELLAGTYHNRSACVKKVVLRMQKALGDHVKRGRTT